MAGRTDRAESIAPPDRGEDPKQKKSKQIHDFHLFIWVVTDLSISRKNYHLLKIFTKAFFSKKIQML